MLLAGGAPLPALSKALSTSNRCMLQVVDYYKGRVVDLVADRAPEDVAAQIRQAL